MPPINLDADFKPDLVVKIRRGEIAVPEFNLSDADTLTPEAKRAIRAYMVRLVILPAGALSIASFLVGYIINNVAVQTAQNQAFVKFTDEFSKRMQDAYATNTSK